MILSGDTSGAITVTVPAVAGTNTITLPAATGTVLVSGNQPTFNYYQSVAQTLTTGTTTKITFTSSNFDTTSGMFASSRFTPTIAGYYQINTNVTLTLGSTTGLRACYIYKNGTQYAAGSTSNGYTGDYSTSSVSSVIYCNGSTDYIEVYAYQNSGGNLATIAGSTGWTSISASLVRAA